MSSNAEIAAVDSGKRYDHQSLAAIEVARHHVVIENRMLFLIGKGIILALLHIAHAIETRQRGTS